MLSTDEEWVPEAYKRLVAAQRIVDPAELREIEKVAEQESQANRIRRKLPKAY